MCDFCRDCDREIDADTLAGEAGQCESCYQSDLSIEWMDAAQATIVATATAHGWSVDEGSRSGLSSRYVEVSRGDDTLTIRISDHVSSVSRGGWDLSVERTGHEHSLAAAVARLTNHS